MRLRKDDIERWITMNGNHIPILKGQSEDEAVNNFIASHYESELEQKSREYKSYYLYDTTKKDYEKGKTGATGVSKREYLKGLSSGREGWEKDYLDGSWFHRIPENVESTVFNSLESITDIKNYNDFEKQLRQKLFRAEVGINADNVEQIMNAFDDEISETYEILIADKRDELESIDIDNSYEVFEKSFETYGEHTEEFKEKIMKSFDTAKNEECKIMLATVTLTGTRFTQNREYDNFGRRLITCYTPNSDLINIMNRDMSNQEDLFHEGFHAVFEKYEVQNTNLKAVMKKELNHSDKIDTIFRYFEDKIADEYGYESKDELIKRREELRDKSNAIYNEALEIALKKHNGIGTAEAYSDAHKYIKENHPEYEGISNDFWKTNRLITAIEKQADNYISWKYQNLYDIISGATRNSRGGGHTKKYWNNDKMNQANEFFAEMSAMKATGNTEEYELVRKFAPNSVKRYEEIFNEIIKNRGRAL